MGKQQYLNLSFQDLSGLLDFYGKELRSQKLLSGGSANTNYYVKCGQQEFILTISQNKSEKQLKPLIDALLYMEKHGYRSTQLLPNKNGLYLSQFDGLPVMLKSFIPGIIPETLDHSQAFSLGSRISELHQLPIPDFLPSGFDYDLDHIENFIASNQNDHPFIDWISQFIDRTKSELNEPLPQAVIHADIFNDNLVISDEEPVIIDFEEICVYSRVFDVGMSFVGVCRTAEGLDLELAKSILRGYSQNTPLTFDEKGVLRIMTAYAAASTAFWRFRQFNILKPNPKMSHHYEEMVQLTDWILEQNFNL